MDELSPQQPLATAVNQVPAPAPQPVFYSLSAEPETPKVTPWFKQKQLVVMVASAVLLMLVITGVVVFAVNMVQGNKTANQVIVNKSAQADQMMANGSSPTAAAREVGLVEVCKTLSAEAYMNCVTLIAMDKDDSSVCDALSGDEKTVCIDRVTTGEAQLKKSYAACSAIKDAELLVACQAVLSADAATANDCVGYGAPESACEAERALAAVVAAGDITACATLAGEAAGGCEDVISSIDADGDGLTIQAEFTHGTSDAQADTDGDGYNDGDEIASGHDPLKK